MVNRIKTYFLVPGWDFPAGSLPLGTILDTPNSLQSTLYKPSSSDIDSPTYPSDKYNFSTSISNSSTKTFGLFAQFLQIFGLGADASVSYNKEDIETYSFDHVHTVWFSPSQKYLENAIKETEVAEFLKQINFKEPVYMITGIKTVTGAAVTVSKSKGQGVSASVGVDGTLVGVPVTIGPEVGYETSKGSQASFKNSSCVVWAYQLMKVRVKKGEVLSKEFTRGALFENVDGNEKTVDPVLPIVQRSSGILHCTTQRCSAVGSAVPGPRLLYCTALGAENQ